MMKLKQITEYIFQTDKCVSTEFAGRSESDEGILNDEKHDFFNVSSKLKGIYDQIVWRMMGNLSLLLQNWKEYMKTLEKISLPMNHGRMGGRF